MTRIRLLLVVAFGAVLVALGIHTVGRFRSGDQLAAPGITQVVQAGDLRVALQLDQPALGEHVVAIAVQDAAGNPVDLRGARLRFTMTEKAMGDITADAQPVGVGRFQARGAFFTMAGRWVVEVMLQRDDGGNLRKIDPLGDHGGLDWAAP